MDDKKPDLIINRPYTEPDPNTYSQYQREIYSRLRNPPISTKFSEWEAKARAILPNPNFLYVYGSACSGTTNIANLAAFDRYRLRPSMLVDATRRNLSVELFGTCYPSPMLLAPVGVQEIVHSDGEEATARAGCALNVPIILSSAATRSIEQVAKANGDGKRWFQLYWPRPQAEEITASLLQRAKDNGFKVLVVTLDTFNLAWRPNDLDTSYLPFIMGQGCQIGFSDPVFNRIYNEMLATDSRGAGQKLAELWDILKRPGTITGALGVLVNAKTMRKARAWLDVLNSGTYRKWEHLEILRKHWGGPIVLKGIQTVEDAHRAIDNGMDGIIVSNHGGRQLDGAIASLDALAEIGADEKVKSSGITILFDSGIRTGSDVLKAVALGAKAVLIGRPYIYGLATAGEAGVRHVIRCILAETDNMLGNLGKTDLSELSRDDLRVMQQLSKL